MLLSPWELSNTLTYIIRDMNFYNGERHRGLFKEKFRSESLGLSLVWECSDCQQANIRSACGLPSNGSEPLSKTQSVRNPFNTIRQVGTCKLSRCYR